MKTQLHKIDSLYFFFFLSFPRISAGITKSVGTVADYATLNAAFDTIIAGAIKSGAIPKQIATNSSGCYCSTMSRINAQAITPKPMNLPKESCQAKEISPREEMTEYFLIK